MYDQKQQTGSLVKQEVPASELSALFADLNWEVDSYMQYLYRVERAGHRFANTEAPPSPEKQANGDSATGNPGFITDLYSKIIDLRKANNRLREVAEKFDKII